ncbi:hypothetical protein Cantr_06589 [Candida viswanathii]|uniref:Uncharacterized protein n=1 Tax=Candida viswanathii TaxID=5486 RepID=A0A367XX27_9ASCO|nr:hypothetical protein Cantr_06589 [Candida viswanathii]
MPSRDITTSNGLLEQYPQIPCHALGFTSQGYWFFTVDASDWNKKNQHFRFVGGTCLRAPDEGAHVL